MAEEPELNESLSQEYLDQIRTVLMAHPEVERAVLFGSRAKRTQRKYSDIDIALFGKSLDRVLWRIHMQLEEETRIPVYFDVVDYKKISNTDLRDHIDRVGTLIYRREE